MDSSILNPLALGFRSTIAALFFGAVGLLLGYVKPRHKWLAALASWPLLISLAATALSNWPRFQRTFGRGEFTDVLWGIGILLAAVACSVGGAYLGAALRMRIASASA